MKNRTISVSYSGLKINFSINRENDIFVRYLGLENKKPLLKEDSLFYSKVVEAEYANSRGDKRRGLKLQNTSYANSCKYVSHSINDNSKGKEIVIITSNKILEIETHYQLYKDIKAISSFNNVKNISDGNVSLEFISSFFQYGITKSNLDTNWLYQASNSWHCEAQWSKFNFLDLGIFNGNEFTSMNRYTLNNTGSWSTKEHLPMVVVEDKKRKTATLLQIESCGSWHIELGDIQNHVYLLASGPEFEDNQWLKVLKPNDTFISVQASLSFGKDFEETIQEITKARRVMRRSSKDLETLPVIFNDYMHALWDVQTSELIRPLVDAAYEIGAEEFCIDAGWFAKGNDWWNILGKWEEEKENFPDGGFVNTINYIKSKGMKVGLWIEIESVGINSPILKEIPDGWFFKIAESNVVNNERYQLNFDNPEVYAYAMSVIDNLMTLYNLDYLKIDYNTDSGVGNEWNSDSAGDGLLKHNKAYIKWINEVLDKYPDLTIENCASGGCRMDSELLKYCPIQSTSDQTNYRKYPYICANVFTACPPEQAAVWSYPINDYEKIMPTDEVVVMNMCNSILGRIHLASFINKLPNQQRDLIREGLKYYKSIIDFKKKSVPVYPRGTAKFFSKEVCGGLKNDNKIVLGLWNTSGKPRIVKVNLKKYNINNVKVAYPISLNTKYTFDNNVLEVSFSEDYGGRIFELLIK